SNNTFTSSTVSASANGSAIRVWAGNKLGNFASVTKAELNDNTITNFPGGAGVLFQAVYTTSGGLSGSTGTPGNTTNQIVIAGNAIAGASAANLMATQAVNVSVSGQGSGRFDIENNGTALNPLANTAGVTIACSAFGAVTVECKINNNRVNQNSNVNGQPGIAVGADGNGDASAVPHLNVAVTNNTIQNTQGNGILAKNTASSGTIDVTIKNNTVSAPGGGVRPGIRVDAGNNTAGENSGVCVDISGNVSAGSGGTNGIGLRKQGTNPSVDAFGIVGMSSATASPDVENFVNGQNPAGNGTLLISATSGFSNCSFSPLASNGSRANGTITLARVLPTQGTHGDLAL